MKGKWLGIAALIVVGGVLLSIASCGRSQQLVSIDIQPNVYTFGASNIPVQLTPARLSNCGPSVPTFILR